MSEYNDNNSSRTKPNYIYSIVSIALVLFLLGFFGLILLHAQSLIKSFKEKVPIMVELDETSSTENIETLRKSLANSQFVKKGSVQFTSKEDAANQMREDFGEDFLKLDLPNPLYDVFTFNVNAAFMSDDSLAEIRSRILAGHNFAKDVHYQESLIEDVAKNVKQIGYIALGVSIFFLLVAITLIHNTIRLALYSNRFLIKNMQLVGASWRFISRPYIIKGVLHGLLSGILAVGLLILLLWFLQNDLPELKTLQDIPSFALLFLALVLLGIGINTLSTYFVVKKYLRMRVDDLY